MAIRMKKAWVLSYPLSAQRRIWSGWADAQADLSLRWAHMPLCCFFHEAAQIRFCDITQSGLFCDITKIEDLTLVVISYEIYETSLRRVSEISYEMTTSVRFCLSYDCFKWGFIALKVDIISIENITLSRTASWRYAPVTKCYVTCGHTIFMTWR